MKQPKENPTKNRPEDRYGANNEFPPPGSDFDGSEYEWRGEQAGRGGQEDYWRGEEQETGDTKVEKKPLAGPPKKP